jgi:hypothetical protein
MKLITVVALVMIAALVGPSKAEKAGGPSGKMEEEIQELHNKLIQAQLNSDIAALDRLLADDHLYESIGCCTDKGSTSCGDSVGQS